MSSEDVYEWIKRKARERLKSMPFMTICVDETIATHIYDVSKYKQEDCVEIDSIGELGESYVIIYSNAGRGYVIPYSEIKVVEIQNLPVSVHNALVYARVVNEPYKDDDGQWITG